MSDTISIIETVAGDLLGKIEIPNQVNVTEADGVFLVNIETEESGILIGHHGKNLESLQIMLGLITAKKLDNWVRILVEVGDYRKRREEQLLQMAKNITSQVIESGQAVEMPYLSPNERRVVHMSLSDHPQVTTESVGVGRDRTLIVKPRAN